MRDEQSPRAHNIVHTKPPQLPAALPDPYCTAEQAACATRGFPKASASTTAMAAPGENSSALRKPRASLRATPSSIHRRFVPTPCVRAPPRAWRTRCCPRTTIPSSLRVLVAPSCRQRETSALTFADSTHPRGGGFTLSRSSPVRTVPPQSSPRG